MNINEINSKWRKSVMSKALSLSTKWSTLSQGRIRKKKKKRMMTQVIRTRNERRNITTDTPEIK